MVKAGSRSMALARQLDLGKILLLLGAITLASLSAFGQQSKEDIPDAPSATRSQQPAPSPSALPPSVPVTRSTTGQAPTPAAQAPDTPVVPSHPSGNNTPDQEVPLIIKNVTQVFVPVTVKDGSGHMVDGLLKNDFSVYEDGVEQTLNFFTSDPYPLSAAVVIDVGIQDDVLRKVNETLPALAGAFSPYDEVAVYNYGTTVTRRSDFTAGDSVYSALQQAKRQGRKGGAPVVDGPFASGPTVNGRAVDPTLPRVSTYHQESRVLNDALLAAAMDLAKRQRGRRRVIFVISDGREYGSRNSYGDVLKAMLTYNINVYAIAVGSSSIKGIRNLETINLPFTGSGNLLPKYATATGGQIFPEFDRNAIETAYAQVTGDARNQYTLGYTAAKGGVSSGYRGIEVRVAKGGLKVFARDGYFPLPPERR
jgi:VWFA-related protein